MTEKRKTGSRLQESGVRHRPVPRCMRARISRASRYLNAYDGMRMTDLSNASEGGTKGG